MIKKETKKKTICEVMKDNSAVFSLTLSQGYANIDFNDKEMFVQFLDDEGYSTDELEIPLKDVEQVSRFMSEMKSLRIGDYKQE